MPMAKPSPSYARTKELIALGRAIRELRIANGHSQESFADEAGLDRSYLGGIERGEHNLAIVNLIKISRALALKPSEILTRAKL